MKKIFSLIIALVMMVSVASAQTVESSRFFENVSVTLYGGGISTQHPAAGQPFFWDGAKTIAKGVRPVAGLELTKYVTPVVGFSVEGLAMFGTTGSYTFVDQSNVVGNLKLNLSNWFGGYPGQPRRVEVVLVPGLGWGHNYGVDNSVNPIKNYLTYNVGAELNINLGKARAWQINIKPVAVWNNYHRELGFHQQNLQGRLQVGLTYKFGSVKKKSHNFVLCPYSVTAADYDAVVSRNKELEYNVDELQNRVQELENRKPVIIDRPVIVEKKHEPALQTVITFPIGSSKLTKVEDAKLGVLGRLIQPDEKVLIVGSADSSTGSAKRNAELSEARANTVKDILVKTYGVAAEKIFVSTALDTNELPEASRSVVITLQ